MNFVLIIIAGFRAVEPDIKEEHSKSDKGRKRSSRKNGISSGCLMDVRLQQEGETLDGVPPWHPDDNIVVTVRKQQLIDFIIFPTTPIYSTDTPICTLNAKLCFFSKACW